MFFSRKRQGRTSAEFDEYIQRIGLGEYERRKRYAMIRRHILRTLICPMTRSQLFAHLEINPSHNEFTEILSELESWGFIIIGLSPGMIRKSDESLTL